MYMRDFVTKAKAKYVAKSSALENDWRKEKNRQPMSKIILESRRWQLQKLQWQTGITKKRCLQAELALKDCRSKANRHDARVGVLLGMIQAINAHVEKRNVLLEELRTEYNNYRDVIKKKCKLPRETELE